jgi:hypothetical protein
VGTLGPAGFIQSDNIGNSTYHALQAKVEKRFSEGLFLLASYTWAKTLTDSSSNWGGFFSTGARDHYNRRLEKAVALYDVPQRYTTAFSYELPIGPKKRFLNAHGVVGKVLEGWQVNAVVQYQSGDPLTVSVNNTLPLFNSLNLPNVVPGVDPKLPTSHFDPSKDLYLNINAFSQPAPFTFGNAPAVLSRVRGFASYREDLGISKQTYITETARIEFRFEMFNVFNRVQFGDPATNVSAPFSFGTVSSQANAPRQGQFVLRLDF